MGKQEYKRYDSSCFAEYYGARLAKDAEVKEGEHGKMVRLTIVATSRNEKFDDLWLEVNVGSFNANAAAYLEKGDVLHRVCGRLALRKWGDDNEKFSIVLDRAELVIPLDLIATLKERGFDPAEGREDGGKKGGGKKAGKPADKKKAGKPADKKAKKPEPVEIPDDDDDVEIDDEDDDADEE